MISFRTDEDDEKKLEFVQKVLGLEGQHGGKTETLRNCIDIAFLTLIQAQKDFKMRYGKLGNVLQAIKLGKWDNLVSTKKRMSFDEVLEIYGKYL